MLKEEGLPFPLRFSNTEGGLRKAWRTLLKNVFFTIAGDQQAGGAVPPPDGGAVQQLPLLPLTGQPDVPLSLDRLQPSGPQIDYLLPVNLQVQIDHFIASLVDPDPVGTGTFCLLLIRIWIRIWNKTERQKFSQANQMCRSVWIDFNLQVHR